LLHATNDNKRAGQAVKCISDARVDCATAAWDIMCERLNGCSFARSLSLRYNLMLRQRPGQSLTEYVRFTRHTFDDYNETCEMIDGYAAIHPHNLGLPASPCVAPTAQCVPILWHRRFGHLNMQSLQAQHTHGVPSSRALAIFLKNVSCELCLLHKATAAPRNTTACAKPFCPLMNMYSDTWGPTNVPSPHGLHYCMLVIDHHTHYMLVRFLKSKDDTCAQLETIMSHIIHLHARHHSKPCAFASVLKFDSDSVFEATTTRKMCAHMGVGVKFSAPYAITCSAKSNAPGT
jgi:hypothetical protein